MNLFKNKQVMETRGCALGVGNWSRRSPFILNSNKPVPFHLDTPRLVNRFSIGCDPEFLLVQTAPDPFVSPNALYKVICASEVGLRLDEAFGADGSGTPVELRAHPSRFAVEVVASLLNTLRLLYATNPQAAQASIWLAGGYVLKVAIGGHVHFGRKAGVREDEIRALNNLCFALECAGLLPGSRERRTKSGYGTFSDYRKQAWGYEYRSFSSWIYHPQVAHLLLTLSKLGVFDPEVWKSFEFALENHSRVNFSPSRVLSQIDNILRFYRYLDDDAGIAFRGLRNLPQGDTIQNIKRTWGLEGGFPGAQKTIKPMPLTIPADGRSLVEITEAIIASRPLPFRVPERTWLLQMPPLPKEVPVFPLNVNGDFNLGETEMLRGLFAVEGSHLVVYSNREPSERGSLGLTPDFFRVFSNPEYKRLKEVLESLSVSLKIKPPSGSRLAIHLGRNVRENASLRGIRHLLTSGMFPVCSAKGASIDFCNSWKERLKRASLL